MNEISIFWLTATSNSTAPRLSATCRPCARGMRTLAVSAKTGEGMGELIALLEQATA
jgi:hypothetical protein